MMNGYTMQSSKELWVHISGASLLKSRNLVLTLLKENATRILEGTLFYSGSSSNTSECKENVLSGKSDEFVQILSELLNVKRGLAFDIFCSFLLHEYKGTRGQLKDHLKNWNQMQDILKMIWTFYRNERLYIIVCLKHILGSLQDKSHPYQSLYEAFFESLKDPMGVIVSNVMTQLEKLISEPAPNRDRDGFFLRDSVMEEWTLFNLKEQSELLQILLIYYKDMEVTSEELYKLLCLFQRHGFGKRQPFRIDNQAFCEHICSIGYLEMTILLECLELQWLLQCSLGDVDDHYLYKDQECLERINISLQSFGTHQEHGVIMLAWMLTWKLLKKDLQTSLGNKGVEIGAFRVLDEALNSVKLTFGEGSVSTLTHVTIYGFIFALLNEYEMDTIGDEENFLKIIQTLIKNETIAQEVWSKGLTSGIGAILSNVLQWFPMRLSNIFELFTPLASAGENSCREIISLMGNLPTFTKPIANSMLRENREDKQEYVKIVSDCFPYGCESFNIEKGSVGSIIIQEENISIIKWQIPVNGWDILFLEIKDILHNQSLNPNITKYCLKTLTTINHFIAALLKNVRTSYLCLEHLYTIILALLSRLTAENNTDINLIASCVRISYNLPSEKFKEIWHDITSSNFFPFLTSNSKSACNIQFSIGLLGHLIAGKECVLGSYVLCMDFLDFTLFALDNICDKDLVLRGCLIYILHDIFPSVLKMKYQSKADQITIGIKCLEIFHKSLTSPKDSNICQMCIHRLHHTEAGKVLLQIVCTGEQNLDNVYGQSKIMLVRLSLSVLNQLLLQRSDDSPLEKSIISSNTVILGITYYSFQKYSPQLAMLAVQILKRFAKQYPKSLLAHFGSKAEAVKDHFMFRLGSLTEDMRLKVALLEFLTVCVVKQPGIINMFVGKEILNKGISESCLSVVLEILKDKKDGIFYCSDIMFTATVEFIHSLWAGFQMLAIKLLKDQSDFWTLLTYPLQKEVISNALPKVVAFIIQTLALEVFYANNLKEELDPRIKEIFKDAYKENKFDTLLNYIRCQMLKVSKVDEHSNQVIENVEGVNSLLYSWRNILVIMMKTSSIESIILAEHIQTSLLDHVLSLLAFGVDRKLDEHLLILLSETVLMLLHILDLDCCENRASWMVSISQILYSVSLSISLYTPRFLLDVISIASLNLQQCDGVENVDALTQEWLKPAVKIYESTLPSVKRSINSCQKVVEHSSLPSFETTTCIVSLCCLRRLVIAQAASLSWIPLFKQSCLFSSLSNLLQLALSRQEDVGLSNAILSLIITTSESEKAAEILVSTGIIPQTTLILDDLKRNSKRPSNVFQAHQMILRMFTTLLQTLGYFFLYEALEYLHVHFETLCECLAGLRRCLVTLDTAGLEEILTLVILVHQMSLYHDVWRIKQPGSFRAMLKQMGIMVDTVVAYLVKPAVFQNLVDSLREDAQTKSNGDPRTNTSSSFSQPIQTRKQHQHSHYQIILKILSASAGVIYQVSETSGPVVSSHGVYDSAQKEKLLSFSPSSSEQGRAIGFGTVLCVVNLCLRFLSNSEAERTLVSVLLERSLNFALTQGLLVSSGMSPRERTSFWRDLEAEMTSTTVMIARYLRRQKQPGEETLLLKVLSARIQSIFK